MLIIKIMGGMGNQFFQYAFALELQNRGKKVKIDTSYYDRIPDNDTVRLSVYSLLGSMFPVASYEEIECFQKKNRGVFWKCVRRCIRKCIYLPVYIDDNDKIKKSIFHRNSGYYIGYWQSEKYFMKSKKQICGIYKEAIGKLDEKNKIIAKEIEDSFCPISIHIRGGDYYSSTNQRTFGNICDENYYKKAINYCFEKFGYCKFYIFTNDLKLAYRVLPPNISYIFVENDEMNGGEDIYLMSLCHHNIIANSSFSWWGAWLNQNPEKIVIAPERWRNDKEPEDICPKDWVRL